MADPFADFLPKEPAAEKQVSGDPFASFLPQTKDGSLSQEKYSQLGSAAVGAAESVAPTAAGLAAAGAIANIVAPISATMAATGAGIIPATILEVGAPMIGGAIVGIATAMGQHAILPDSVNKEIAQAEKDNPNTFFAAGLLTQLPFFGVGTATKTTRAVLGGLGGLTEVGSELSQGKSLDPAKIGLSTVAGGSLTKPTKAGNWLTQGAFSGHSTPLQSKDLPQEDPRLTETINKWGKLNESEVTLPATPKEAAIHPKELVQTALKDNVTGEIKPTGPKHPEDLKTETIKKDKTEPFPETSHINVNKEEKIVLPEKNKYTIKDQVKSDKATKFIGRGSPTSSTRGYAEVWGGLANSGDYHSSDVVFISAEGARTGRQTLDFLEIDTAIEAGAKFVTDTPEHRNRGYNVGEREVAEYLTKNGYTENHPGEWSPSETISTSTGGQLKYQPGFLTKDGTFLNRKEAAGWARETGQIVQDHKFERPSEGLHSGDLRTAGDPKFDLSVKIGAFTPEAGGKGFARRDKTTGQIEVNPEAVKKSYESSGPEDRPWIKEHFPTVEKYQEFITEHEQVHGKTPQKEGESTLDYEKRVTAKALENIKAKEQMFTPEELAPPKSIPSPESISTKAEFDEAGKQVLKDHGPDVARKFAKDVANHRRIKENETIPQVLERNRVWNKSVANASTPLEKAAIINGDIVLEQIDHSNTIYGAQEAIGQALNDIRVAIRDSDIARHDIEKAVPNKDIRELMFRAAEGEKWYDKLYTNKQKEEALSILVRSIQKKKALLSRTEDLNARTSLEEEIRRSEYSLNKRQSLGSEEHAIPVLEAVQERLATLGKQAKELGLMKGLLNNYIPHVLDFSKTNMNKGQQQEFLKKVMGTIKGSKLERDFTQQRYYATARELEKAVEGTGVVVHTDIAKIMQAYEKSMQTAIIQQKLLDHLSSVKDKDGKPMVVDITKLSGEEAAKYLKDKYVPFQGKGSNFLEKMLVSPEIETAMGHMATQKDPSFALRSMGAITHLTKVVNTVGSLFHAKSLAEVNLLINPVGALKEVFTAGAGTRAAVRELQTGRGNTILKDFIKSGLVIEMPEDIQRTIVADLGKTLDRGLGHTGFGPNLKAVQRATDPFDQYILQNLNKFTWDYMHSGSKVRVAMDLFAKAKARNPDIPDAVHMKEISNFVNNAFGGVNWLQEANQVQNQFLRGLAQGAAGIRGREYGQILMFAPDWTYSTLKTMVNAFPKELMKPKNWELRAGLKGIYNPTKTGDYARRYALATAITYATVLNGINMAMSGHPIWENKDPTRVDLGDGTSMQGAKHSLEFFHLLRNPDAYLGNKLGFIPKSVAIITTGTAYPSPTAPKLKDTSMVGRAKAVALGASPFQVSSGAQAPEGEGVKRAVASTLGFPIYGRQTSASMEAEARVTKSRERAQRRRERAKEKQERGYSHQ